MQGILHIAVRSLVSHVLSKGDLSYGFQGFSRQADAIRAHQRIQANRPAGYRPEVSVSHTVSNGNLTLVISGRIDGVFAPLDTNDVVYVEEIKTTTDGLERLEAEENPLHWGQAKTYAYLYALDRGLSKIAVRLTYCHLDTRQELTLERTWPRDALKAFFDDLVACYLEWAATLSQWHSLRNTAISQIPFPFPGYRNGQRSMAVNVYNAVRGKRQLLLQAPTGIGKTMAALFPSVKSLAEGNAAKIFYLTARSTARTVAEKALDRMRKKGLRIKSVTLTAKDTVCFCPEAACLPEECPFAKGFYDRLRPARNAVFADCDTVDRPALEQYARHHRLCPFELSLELALYADVIICDYNYAFDPRVFLRRFFQERAEAYVFLIDEAHNLVDRGREMFSAALDKQMFLSLRRQLKNGPAGLYRLLGRINQRMAAMRKACHAAGAPLSDSAPPDNLTPLLREFVFTAERRLRADEAATVRAPLLDAYFAVSAFMKIYERFDDSYVTCTTADGNDLRIKLFCVDPSAHLQEALTRCAAAVFFSATLSPLGYFRHMLGCDENAGLMALSSPFPADNLCVLSAGRISTRYRDRTHSLTAVTDAIRALVTARTGNYLVFFPSYAYLTAVHAQLEKTLHRATVLPQLPNMTEEQRMDFLARFSPACQETLVGLVVMGGIFAEGIDLAGERLCAAAVVGVGLPGISFENDLIRNHFETTRGSGFAYAYQYPGINRVLQAAGRVIRTEKDRGVILLIDERFMGPSYRNLLPAHWRPVCVTTPDQITRHAELFWAPP